MKQVFYKLLLIFAVSVISGLIFAIPVLATALFTGVIKVTNSGTAASDVSVNFSLNTQSLIDNGFCASDLSDVDITYNSVHIPFMPGYGSNPWCLFLPAIGASSIVNCVLSTGGATGGRLAWFPGTTGGTIPDTITPEGNDFVWHLHGVLLDTSIANDKYIISHWDAANGGYQVYGSNTTAGLITTKIEYPATYTLSQDTGASSLTLYSGASVRAGGRFTGLGTVTKITSVELYMRKDNSPTGTITINVRNGVTDALLGTLGTINAATLTTSWVYYTFNNPVDVNVSDFRICAEYSGGSASNYVEIGILNSNVLANANACYYSGSWTDNAGWDLRFRNLNYIAGLTSSTFTISGVDTQHIVDIAISLSGGTFTTSIDGSSNSTAFAGSIPNSTSAITVCKSNIILYVESIEYEQGGAKVDLWDWEYNTTFTGDTTGNILTPSFRTTSSDADVSAQLISFEPTDTSELESFSFTDDLPDIGTPESPSQMYTEGTYDKIPGADSVNEMLGEGGVPYSLWWYPFIYFSICIIGLIVYGATQGPMSQRSTSNPFDGSLLIMAVVMEVLIVLFGIMNPVPLWPAYLFPIPALAIIISRRHQAWG